MAKLDRQELAAYAQSRGYSLAGDGLYGVYGGYPFAAVRGQGMSKALILQMRVAGTVDGQLVKEVRREVPKDCSVQGGRQAGILSAVCGGKTTSEVVQRVEQMMAVFAAALRERGLRPPENCPICGQGGCDALALVSGYVPVHRSCIHDQVQSTAARVADNDLMGNYLTGFLGALLGGLVGAIPSVLAAVLLERVSAFLYALIPLAAYYGYKLCRGKMNKGALVCAVISSVVNLFMVEYINQFIWLCMEFELTLKESLEVLFTAIGDYTLVFLAAVAQGELMESLLQGALFMALGLWLSWRAISRTGKQEVQSAAAVQTTLQPWPVQEGGLARPGVPETPEKQDGLR